MLWESVAVESPSAWRLWGREDGDGSWHLVDTMEAGTRNEPATYKHINRTCHSPGFYAHYKWAFSEYAPRYGRTSDTNDGHRLRDIVLNPNGFALHYGSPMARETLPEARASRPASAFVHGVGLTNLAAGRPAHLSSTYGNQPYQNEDGSWTSWALASHATDSTPPSTAYISWGCATSNAVSGESAHLVVDLGGQAEVGDVVLQGTVHSAWWRQRLTAGSGTVVGLSTGWDRHGTANAAGASGNASSSLGAWGESAYDPGNHAAGAGDEHFGHYDWGAIGERDCWGRGDCGDSENVTRCGGPLTEEPLGGGMNSFYTVDCGGAVGRYLFVYQLSEGLHLPVCQVGQEGPLLRESPQSRNTERGRGLQEVLQLQR